VAWGLPCHDGTAMLSEGLGFGELIIGVWGLTGSLSSSTPGYGAPPAHAGPWPSPAPCSPAAAASAPSSGPPPPRPPPRLWRIAAAPARPSPPPARNAGTLRQRTPGLPPTLPGGPHPPLPHIPLIHPPLPHPPLTHPPLPHPPLPAATPRQPLHPLGTSPECPLGALGQPTGRHFPRIALPPGAHCAPGASPSLGLGVGSSGALLVVQGCSTVRLGCTVPRCAAGPAGASPPCGGSEPEADPGVVGVLRRRREREGCTTGCCCWLVLRPALGGKGGARGGSRSAPRSTSHPVSNSTSRTSATPAHSQRAHRASIACCRSTRPPLPPRPPLPLSLFSHLCFRCLAPDSPAERPSVALTLALGSCRETSVLAVAAAAGGCLGPVQGSHELR